MLRLTVKNELVRRISDAVDLDLQKQISLQPGTIKILLY
jgi:hypothetical protein